MSILTEGIESGQKWRQIGPFVAVWDTHKGTDRDGLDDEFSMEIETGRVAAVHEHNGETWPEFKSRRVGLGLDVFRRGDGSIKVGASIRVGGRAICFHLSHWAIW